MIGANGAGKSTLLRILATLCARAPARSRCSARAAARGVEGSGPARLPRPRAAALPRAQRAREPGVQRPPAPGRRAPASGSRPCSSASGWPAAASELVRNLSAGMLPARRDLPGARARARAAAARRAALAPRPRRRGGRRRAARRRPPGRTRVVVTHEVESGLRRGRTRARPARRRLGRLRGPAAGARRRRRAARSSRGASGETPTGRSSPRTCGSSCGRSSRCRRWLLFAATTFVLFRFGLDRESLAGGLAAGVLLATVLFAGDPGDQPGLRRRARAGRLRR